MPFTFVVVEAELPRVPQVRVVGLSIAVAPPPRSMLKLTGTFVRMVPFAVVTVTSGRHSAGNAVPTIPWRQSAGEWSEASGPAATIAVWPPTVRLVAGSRILVPRGAGLTGVGAGTRMNSVTVPPTPPPNESSGSTGPNGLNSVTVPPTPPPKNSCA